MWSATPTARCRSIDRISDNGPEGRRSGDGATGGQTLCRYKQLQGVRRLLCGRSHLCGAEWTLEEVQVDGGPPIIFRLLPEGNYTAIAYITDKTEQARYHETTPVGFTVVGLSEFNLRNALLAERSRIEQQFPEDIDLLRWAELENGAGIDGKTDDGNLVLPRASVTSTKSPMLVIGVKTAVVTSLPRRQAIRDTWGIQPHFPTTSRFFSLVASRI